MKNTRTPVPLSPSELEAVDTLSETLHRSRAQVLQGLIRVGLEVTQDDVEALEVRIRQ